MSKAGRTADNLATACVYLIHERWKVVVQPLTTLTKHYRAAKIDLNSSSVILFSNSSISESIKD